MYCLTFSVSGKAIAPKKAKAIESLVVQKQLQKAINESIEKDMKERASKDTTGFKVRTSSPPPFYLSV